MVTQWMRQSQTGLGYFKCNIKQTGDELSLLPEALPTAKECKCLHAHSHQQLDPSPETPLQQTISAFHNTACVMAKHMLLHTVENM